jgi:cysteine desulfurase
MDANGRIYLDYAATTPVDRRVQAVMEPYFSDRFGNPSSIHFFGQQAEAALENARQTVANCLGCAPDEIIFTSCGSESDNLAIRGAALAMRKKTGANRLLVSPVEHHAVSKTAEQLRDEFGFELDYLPVDEFGKVDPNYIQELLDRNAALVSVIYANNEIGTINPIAEIGAICAQRGVPFHTDAVQAAAYLPVDMASTPVSLLAIGAHKFYGPKGIGALYCRKGTPLMPIITGGGHEFGLRAGTQNVPYIVGLAEALKLAQNEITQRREYVQPLRDQMIGTILEEIPNVKLTGHPSQRLPNHSSFVFENVDGNELLMMLDVAGFACSSGSACRTGNPEPSEVLTAIGLSRSWALGSLRVTLGMGTTPDHVEAFLRELPAAVARCRRNP